jgi:competence protein ComEA
MRRGSVAVLAAVAAAVAVGAWFAFVDTRSAPPIVIADPRPDATIVVAVGGAVASPGTYALPGDARAEDALRAAGGPTGDADLAALNLARRLRDEDQILVARLAPTAVPGETAAPAPPAPATLPIRTPTPAVASGQPALVDLNTASVAELDGLPGIGPVLAQRIVDRRTAVGPFRVVDDLVEVQGISTRMVEELRPLVTVGR